MTLDQKEELFLNLTRLIVSNLVAGSLNKTSRNLLEILTNCSSPEVGLKLSSCSDEELREPVIKGFSATLEKLWEPTEKDLISIRERQIMAYCAQLKQGGTSLKAVVRDICHHFSVPIPKD